jgi:hypothetical protein
MAVKNAKLENLNDTITELRIFLEQRIASKDDEERKLQSYLREQEEELKETLRESEQMGAWLAEHDTFDDDVLIGQDDFVHQRSLVRLTPTFRVYIQTQYPIRRVDNSKVSAGSKWVPRKEEYQEGGQSYRAVLKNKRLSSANASVRLYGRRNEVYEVEIGRHHAKQKFLAACEVQQMDKVKSSGHELSRFRRAAVHYDNHRLFAASDLRRIEKHKQHASQDDSTFILCQDLRLRSVVWKEHVLSKSIHEQLNSPHAYELIRSQQTAQNELMRYLQIAGTKFLGAHDQGKQQTAQELQTSQQKLDHVLRLERPRYIGTKENLTRAEEQCISKRGRNLVADTLAALDVDNKEIEEILRETSGTIKNQRDELMNDSGFREAKRKVSDIYVQGCFDSWATGKVISFMGNDQQSWPIAVYACFSETGSLEDGWMEVWEGVRKCKEKGVTLVY